MNRIMERAKEIEQEIIENRRFLHQNAECGVDLPITTEFVMKKLIELGYEPEEICQGGVVATVGKENGKTILLRADMDGLPLIEETDLSFKSVTPYAHACGHDVHVAMLLGAAKLLKEQEKELKGQVKLMFQPDEEGMTGAKSMVDAGVLQNPKVDVAVAVHIMTQYESGQVSYKKGVSFASNDSFEIVIQGKGGHGAVPHQAIDPINIGVHIHLALQALISRESNPSESTVLTIGCIQGGSAANIIPDTVIMRGTLRTYNKKTREYLKQRLVEVVEGTAHGFRGSAKVHFIHSTPSVICDPDFAEEIVHYLTPMIGKEHIVENEYGMTGSEDFAYISDEVPSVLFVLGGGNEEEGYLYGQHHPKVKFNEDVFYIGTAIYVTAAVEWLRNN